MDRFGSLIRPNQSLGVCPALLSFRMGAAIGIVCLGSDLPGCSNPRLVRNLPGWPAQLSRIFLLRVHWSWVMTAVLLERSTATNATIKKRSLFALHGYKDVF